MRLEDLKPQAGSRTAPKRLGRGIGSGLGKTSGKGHKGAKARSGGGKRPGFEGGQLPLTRRVPRRGFTNVFGKQYAIVNIAALEAFNDGDTVNFDALRAKGLMKKQYDGLRVLGGGDLTRKLTVQAAYFTPSAREKIEALGGKAEVV